MSAFEDVIQKYRDISFSQRDKGYRFERLMRAFLKTYPLYGGEFDQVWLWNEFPSRRDFGSGDKDLGVDLVARTKYGDYWAVQCKCYDENARIDKPKVDTFLSTSGKSFYDTIEAGKKVNFTYRLWIDTTLSGFNAESEATIKNQSPQIGRLGYFDLLNAPVDWVKLEKGISGEAAAKKKYAPKPHQQTAMDQVHGYFKRHERGKLIMACGTGKTFTSLRIAENETGKDGLILFLVPSIALLGQTLKEWKFQSVKPVYPICICSDAGVSKSKDDISAETITDLALPASTNTKNISRQIDIARFQQQKDGGLIVVFSTYQSIDVTSEVQKSINRRKKDSFVFDLIVCDEAHRTTGVTLAGADDSAFVKVHNNDFLKAQKRMYMTATPRLYSESAQKKAREAEALLCSMDDTAMYGEEMYRIGFGEAVDKKLLSDYKVIVLTIEETQLTGELKKSIEDRNAEIDTEDALKIIGCINALSKKSLTDKELFEGVDPAPMRSAVAFCRNIAISKATAAAFNDCREAYFSTLSEEKRAEIVTVEAGHVDGTMGAQTREAKLQWLKSADASKHECNILNNVRCLSEGVDVPSLDAVMFLSARNSQIDVVQSVGRVMRIAPDKKYGYIIIPVVVLPEAEPEKILASDRFKVVWTVLNALRAHDDRFNATINKIELNKKKPSSISVTGTSIGGGADDSDADSGADSGKDRKLKSDFEKQMELEFARFQGIIYAKMVQKCGSKLYWEQWAADVAKIAERHIEQITVIVSTPGQAKDEFDRYLSGLRKNINPSVTGQEAVEMLAQHIITQPVFEALFEDYSFVKNNPVSQSLQGIIGILNEKTAKDDTEKLNRFHVSVQKRVEGIDNSEAKQKVIVELYDKFFRTAFPKVTEKLGIVYTPVEVVDFIIHSIEDVLQKEFNRSMTDENVHILDPFTGTGTFITRLLQSGIIKPNDLERKYTKEIHANEIILLAYYIASINIENVYHDLLKIAEPYNDIFYEDKELYVADVVKFPEAKKANKKGREYTAFPGICLTDTFQLGETAEGENLFSEIFPQNSERVLEQKKTPLRIIMGNPPYSVGQKSANDNAQNQTYPKLEMRIAETYAAASTATNKNSLYDTYIKAFRWSTDRLDPENGGIICFVSNGAWIDGNATGGFRNYLENEFSSIYVFNLRGNCRTSGELRRREKDNVFGLGSRTPISITLLVKNPKSKTTKAIVHYYDIGDYLSREEKLGILHGFVSVNNPDIEWITLTPDKYNDWLNKCSGPFETFPPMGDKDNKDVKCFFNPIYSRGVATARDHFCWNYSDSKLTKNIKTIIDFYNEQCAAFHVAKEENEKLKPEDFISFDSKKITWNRGFKQDIERGTKFKFFESNIYTGLYRPFNRSNIYFTKELNDMTYQMQKLFPSNNIENIAICISGIGGSKENTTIIADIIPDLNCLDSGTQCFPLYWYEKKQHAQGSLFEKGEDEYVRHDGMSDFIYDQAKTRYGSRVIKEDIFYYVYGILHNHEYRKTFANDLKKMLPRLPLVEKPQDFWDFSKAGKQLADLHLNYEEQPKLAEVKVSGAEHNNFIVNQMKFPEKNKKDTIIYNAYITVSNIPGQAYQYIVNGKSAVEWIMERYAVTTHKESGIKNDPNDWAIEHENPRYILDLLCR